MAKNVVKQTKFEIILRKSIENLKNLQFTQKMQSREKVDIRVKNDEKLLKTTKK